MLMLKYVSVHLAHEVYVLSQEKINNGQNSTEVNIWKALHNAHNIELFIFFAALICGVLAFAVYLKYRGTFDKLSSTLDKGSDWVIALIRIAFGASLIVSASNEALYGPELPLHSFVAGGFIKIILIIIGLGLVAGIATRTFAVIAGAIWFYALLLKGPYMFTYSNYIGEAIALVFLPLTVFSIDNLLVKAGKIKKRKFAYAEYSFPVARVLFAFSLLYTALTIKFTHTMLTLDVVNDYHLTRYFPFEPLFIVLGAALIEVLVAVTFMAGFLQRFMAVIFLFVMTLSLLFFKESVWPHYLLIALGVGMLIHKPDKFTLDSKLFVHKKKLARKR